MKTNKILLFASSLKNFIDLVKEQKSKYPPTQGFMF